MENKEIKFNCPSCNHEMSMELQVVATEMPIHVYEHVMECKEHYERAIDFIFTEFAKDGVAVSVSGIKQVLNYFNAFLYVAVAEYYDGEEGTEDGEESESV